VDEDNAGALRNLMPPEWQDFLDMRVEIELARAANALTAKSKEREAFTIETPPHLRDVQPLVDLRPSDARMEAWLSGRQVPPMAEPREETDLDDGMPPRGFTPAGALAAPLIERAALAERKRLYPDAVPPGPLEIDDMRHDAYDDRASFPPWGAVYRGFMNPDDPETHVSISLPDGWIEGVYKRKPKTHEEPNMPTGAVPALPTGPASWTALRSTHPWRTGLLRLP
jgi:hypothetical protein